MVDASKQPSNSLNAALGSPIQGSVGSNNHNNLGSMGRNNNNNNHNNNVGFVNINSIGKNNNTSNRDGNAVIAEKSNSSKIKDLYQQPIGKTVSLVSELKRTQQSLFAVRRNLSFTLIPLLLLFIHLASIVDYFLQR